MQTIAWRAESNTVVLVHGNREPADDEWDTYVAELGAFGSPSERLRVLIVTPGPGPNMLQRKRLNEAFGARPNATAVVSGSAVARAVVSILRLRNPYIRAFDPNHLEDAYQHLQLDEAEQTKMRRAVQELRAQVAAAG